MKSHLLPLAAVAGAIITLSLTAITLAAPAGGAESPAAMQVRQTEQQSRLREWSQGLGVDLSGSAMTAQAEAGRSTSTVSNPASSIAASEKLAKNHDADRDHDKRDRAGNGGHDDDDADENRS